MYQLVGVYSISRHLRHYILNRTVSNHFMFSFPQLFSTVSNGQAIERFKKSLFHYGSSPYSLKVELNKVNKLNKVQDTRNLQQR
jgi:hypothetical protein